MKILSKVHSKHFISLINNEIDDVFKSQTLNSGNHKNEAPLSFMYFEARSLLNKRNVLASNVSSNHPDVIAISETWASPESPDELYSLPGYNLYRAGRQDKRGGGVMVYVNTTIASSEVLTAQSNDFDLLFITFSLVNGMKVGFVCVSPAQYFNCL